MWASKMCTPYMFDSLFTIVIRDLSTWRVFGSQTRVSKANRTGRRRGRRRSSSPPMALWAARGNGDRYLSLVGGGSPSRFRFWCPTTALRPRRRRRRHGIRSSRASPRLGDALLQHRWRAHGGGVRLCWLVYKSRSTAAFHLVVRRGRRSCVSRVQRMLRVLRKTGEWIRLAAASGGHQQQACIQGRRSSGRGPDLWAFSNNFCSSERLSVYDGPHQNRYAVELLSAMGSSAASGVSVFRRRVSGFVCWFGRLSSVSFTVFLYLYCSIFLN